MVVMCGMCELCDVWHLMMRPQEATLQAQAEEQGPKRAVVVVVVLVVAVRVGKLLVVARMPCSKERRARRRGRASKGRVPLMA